MKKIILPALMLCMASTLLVAQPEKEVPSTIQKVTVYLQGAQVSRSAKAAVPAGASVLKFSGLSPMLDPESVQVSATGNFTILSVNHQVNYLKETEPGEEVKRLQAEKNQLQGKLDRELVNIQVMEEEERLILANKTLGGDKGWTAEDLKTVADLYRVRLTELKVKKLELAQVVKKFQEDIAKIQNQINELGAKRRNAATSEVLVAISAPAAGQAEFKLSYVAPNAGWTPAYDIRVQDISKPVALTYKANITQNTGEDWPNVQLSLSTGNPAKSNIRPELQPWWLRFYEPVAAFEMISGRAAGVEVQAAAKAKPVNDRIAADEMRAVSGPSVEQIGRTTTIEFQIAQPYSIPAATKPLTVIIAEEEMPAYYEYYCAPKLDKTAYLTAGITGWDTYNLLSGEALLFFEGAYVGKSFLNTEATGDTLLLSLGRDEGIVVERTREKEFSNRQFLGAKTTQTTGWNIEVRNKKKQAVAIVVEDQYPLSTNEEIEVTLDAAKGAANDPALGKLSWRLQLPAGKAEKLNFRYSVKYPRRRQLTLE